MATLLSAVTTDGAGTGASHSGPCTVFVRGTLDGAKVIVQVSDNDTNYVKADTTSVDNKAVLKAPGAITVCCYGTYYIRCVVQNAGSSTSITAISTQ